MGIIILLISISLFIAVGFLIAFLWNLKSGQYDDTYSPSVRMLFENKPKHPKRDVPGQDKLRKQSTDINKLNKK